VSEYLDRFTEATLQLGPEYVKWMTGDRLERSMNGFFNISGIRGVVAAVDGCHIEIITPARREGPGDYNSFKKRHTAILHAAVDCDGLFVHVTVGWPGAMSDSTILRRTNIPELSRFGCYPESTAFNVPRFLLGDGAVNLL